MNKAEKIIKAIVLVIALAGISLTTIYGNWQITLGVFLLMWSNNYSIDMKNKKK